jgi:hypothetical protein
MQRDQAPDRDRDRGGEEITDDGGGGKCLRYRISSAAKEKKKASSRVFPAQTSTVSRCKMIKVEGRERVG